MKSAMISLVLSLAFTACALAAGWEDNFDQALSEAKQAGKYVLMDFSGSDWCGWCVRLDKEVFDRPAFKKYAKENLVLFIADFPRQTPQGSRLKKQNQELASRYGIRGFPTVVLLSPAGEEVARTGYRPGGAEGYVEHLKGIIDGHRNAAKP